MSGQYQERKEYFKQYRERTKKDYNKRDMITMKRIKIG